MYLLLFLKMSVTKKSKKLGVVKHFSKQGAVVELSAPLTNYDFHTIEEKWQKKWEEEKVFEANEEKGKKKYYVLEMFPYPSASYLHMGHVKCYSIGDIVARYKRMRGFNVLYPMGFDAFGLPAENAAIKEKTHPKKYTEHAISTIQRLMKELGLSYDWRRSFATCDPEYYRWNQWLFLKMLKEGIAYRKKAPVNWCPSCKTVLANEEVIDGKCWRCESVVSLEQREQWFLKITDYADELLSGLMKIEWPEKVKEMQRNWIGKSEGTLAKFMLKGSKEYLDIFTTRIDTIFSVTFLVMAPDHSKVKEFVQGTNYEEQYKKFMKQRTASQKLEADKEKEGFFTGRYVINPATGKEIPVWVANFVLSDYGTGVVMADAHDQRDYDFAHKYNIPLVQVLKPKIGEWKENKAFEGYGVLYNSGQFNGLTSEEAILKIQKWLESKNLARCIVQYKLRDWLISRQRYWGTPIPVVYCNVCGVVPVSDGELPIRLPENVEFTGKGNPLLTSKEFLETKCPKCGKKARRETDTMATFFDSSWYFLRYCDPQNSKLIFDPKKIAFWMPVDQYIGGIEHAVLHLLYARFFTKFLRDLKLLDFDEPFLRLFNQGIIHKEGKRMSKSHGNTVTAEEISAKYGIDTARLFLSFVASPEKDIEWDNHGIEGAYRAVKRFLQLFEKVGGSADSFMEHKLHSALRDLEESYERFEFNKGVISFMSFVNWLSEKDKVPATVLEKIVLAISPVMPHIAEELWEMLGKNGFVSLAEWPKYDESKIDEKLEEAEKSVDKSVSDIMNVLGLVKEKQGKEGKKVYLYVLPQEKEAYDTVILSRRVGKEVIVYAVNDKQKYDPQGKAGKAKPGKPGIYVV